MTKKILLLISIVSFASLVYIIVSSVIKNTDKLETKVRRISPNLMSGPVIHGADITKGEKNFTINIKADKLFFKNGKILFFETALIKKLVAINLRVTVYINGKKIITLGKSRESIQPSLNKLSINNPQIFFIGITDLKKMTIRKAIIDLKSKKLILYTNKGNLTFHPL